MSDQQPPSLDERVAKLAEIMHEAFPSVHDLFNAFGVSDSDLVNDLIQLGYSEDEARHVLQWYDAHFYDIEWHIEDKPREWVLSETGYNNE